MIFLSYGVVALPKKFLSYKSAESTAYFNVYLNDEIVQEQKFRVEELIANLLALAKQHETGLLEGENVRNYVAKIFHLCPDHLVQRAIHLEFEIVEEKYADGDRASFERL